MSAERMRGNGEVAAQAPQLRCEAHGREPSEHSSASLVECFEFATCPDCNGDLLVDGRALCPLCGATGQVVVATKALLETLRSAAEKDATIGTSYRDLAAQAFARPCKCGHRFDEHRRASLRCKVCPCKQFASEQRDDAPKPS